MLYHPLIAERVIRKIPVCVENLLEESVKFKLMKDDFLQLLIWYYIEIKLLVIYASANYTHRVYANWSYTFNANFKDFTETINKKPSLKICVLIYP